MPVAENTEQIELVAIYPEFEDTLGIQRYISQKERDSYDDADFAGPSKSFPITTQAQLDAAAHLIGHADNPEAVKAKAIKIAKRKGFKLPDAWQEDEKPVNKTDEADILRTLATMPSEAHIFAPIERINKAKREVTLRATSEAEDSYGTVIGFDASKEAFGKWRGNIREMHQNVAVGRAFKIDPVDNEKAIDITLHISKGAPDTWEKVLDGTLIGGSIGARNGKWGQKEINGKSVPYLERYDLVEVSLVDNPSNPDCSIALIRADMTVTDVLDSDTTPTTTADPDTARAGARFSGDTQKKIHSARDSMVDALKTHCDNCNCDECSDISNRLSSDKDGSADGDGSGDGESRAFRALIQKILTDELKPILEAQAVRSMAPHIQRLSGISAQLAQNNIQPETTQQESPAIERRFDGIESKLKELDKVRDVLTSVEDLVKRIAEQPQQAQPIVNPSAVNPALLRMFQPEQPQQQEQPSLVELARSGQASRQQQVDGLVAFLQGSNGNRR